MANTVKPIAIANSNVLIVINCCITNLKHKCEHIINKVLFDINLTALLLGNFMHIITNENDIMYAVIK